MIIACIGEADGYRPTTACRIVEFRVRAKSSAAAVKTACNEHLAVGQQCRRVAIPSGRQAAGDHPSPVGWIVELRALERAGTTVITARDEQLAVGQQSRRVTRA